MTRLHNLGKGAMGFYFLSCEHELIIDVEQNKQTADDQAPLREQPQSPLEGHAAEKSKEQRRGTERRQQARGVAHNEYEEDNEVRPGLSQVIRPQEWPDQQHRCARCTDDVREKRSKREKYGIN